MKIVQIAISSFIPFVTSQKTFAQVRGLVEQVENENLTGAEKKTAVLTALKDLGVELATWLFNLLVEMAVLWLKSKQGAI